MGKVFVLSVSALVTHKIFMRRRKTSSTVVIPLQRLFPTRQVSSAYVACLNPHSRHCVCVCFLVHHSFDDAVNDEKFMDGGAVRYPVVEQWGHPVGF